MEKTMKLTIIDGITQDLGDLSAHASSDLTIHQDDLHKLVIALMLALSGSTLAQEEERLLKAKQDREAPEAD
jgi:hypothetical protein